MTANTQNLPAPPRAEQRPYSYERHGIRVEDPYAWLRDKGYPNVDDADVLAYLRAENAYFEAAIKPHGELVETLFQEMKGRIEEDDSTVPVREGDWLYWTAFKPGTQYRFWYRKPAAGGPDQLIFDENAEAAGKDYFRLGAFASSPDGKLAATLVDDDGSERFKLVVRDLATGKVLETVTNVGIGSPVWTNDSKGLVFTEVNDQWRSYRARYHVIGRPAAETRTLYEEKADIAFSVEVARSTDNSLIFISTRNNSTSEVRFVSADKPETAPVLVSPRRADRQYDGRLRPAGRVLGHRRLPDRLHRARRSSWPRRRSSTSWPSPTPTTPRATSAGRTRRSASTSTTRTRASGTSRGSRTSRVTRRTTPALIQNVADFLKDAKNPGIFFGVQSSDCVEFLKGLKAAGVNAEVVVSTACVDDTVLGLPESKGMNVELQGYNVADPSSLTDFAKWELGVRDKAIADYGPKAAVSDFMKDSFSTVVWGWQIANQLIADGKDPFDTKVLGDALANLGSYHVVGRNAGRLRRRAGGVPVHLLPQRHLPACGTGRSTPPTPTSEQVHRRHRADEHRGQEQPAEDGLTGTLDSGPPAPTGAGGAHHRIRSSRA